MSRCPRCPVALELHCPGLDARRLCDLIDPVHPDYRPGYRATILRHAGAAPQPGLTAEQIARIRQIRACPFRSVTPPCGCSGARCGLRLDPLGPAAGPRQGAAVSWSDCLDCVQSFG